MSPPSSPPHPPGFLNIWQRVEATWQRGSSRNAGPHGDVTSQRALLTPLAQRQSAGGKQTSNKRHPAPLAPSKTRGGCVFPHLGLSRVAFGRRPERGRLVEQQSRGRSLETSGPFGSTSVSVWTRRSFPLAEDAVEIKTRSGSWRRRSRFGPCEKGTFKNRETLARQQNFLFPALQATRGNVSGKFCELGQYVDWGLTTVRPE